MGFEREQFRVEAANTAWLRTDGPAVQPVLHLRYERSHDRLQSVLAPHLRANLSRENLAVSFRVVAPASGGDEGVLSLSDRVTARYLLETTAAVSRIQALVQAAQAYADALDTQPSYGLRLHAEGSVIASVDTGLLLVYDTEGTLRRDTSLIPGEVEL